MTEEWRTIAGYTKYEVSSAGRIRSHWRPTTIVMKTRRNPQPPGYLQVDLVGDTGHVRPWKIHKLVTAAFLGPRPDGLVTRHLNGDPTDNRLANLAYGTIQENRLDVIAHGNDPHLRLNHCPNGHEYTPANTRRDEKSHRRCRTCRAAVVARYTARRRGVVA